MTERRVTFSGYDHVDVRVRSLEAVRAFYDVLMPELGLVDIVATPGSIEYYEPHRTGHARRFFGLHEDRGHRPNASRICFAADTPADVDRLAGVVRRAGGLSIEGPEIPYSSEKYYAVFFKDPSGNALEIAYRRAHDDGVAVGIKNDERGEVIEAAGAFGTA
jgi:catechol 2,3-dioxygenase-like lactoylglutathione lyase family enzyme